MSLPDWPDFKKGNFMPKREARNPTSAKGDWFKDERCIDCAASREVAPGLIVERGSVVYLWRDAFLFSGDSLAWSRDVNRLRPMGTYVNEGRT